MRVTFIILRCGRHGIVLFSHTLSPEYSILVSHDPEEAALSMGQGLWLGYAHMEKDLADVTTNTGTTFTKYSNWKSNFTMYNPDCTFINSDGFWEYESKSACAGMRICTVCSFTKSSMFTMKGICFDSLMEWNYYMATDEWDTISYFGGYLQKYKLEYLKNDWRLETEEAEMKIGGSEYPVGRHNWEWFDQSCNGNKIMNKSFAFSVCEVGKMFTCDSGICIDMKKRCDNNYDCKEWEKGDESDEKNCEVVHIPSSYTNTIPPTPTVENLGSSLLTNVDVQNIRFIDTVSMKIGLLIDIEMQWTDHRLQFNN